MQPNEASGEQHCQRPRKLRERKKNNMNGAFILYQHVITIVMNH